jgi:hypothetical protein
MQATAHHHVLTGLYAGLGVAGAGGALAWAHEASGHLPAATVKDRALLAGIDRAMYPDNPLTRGVVRRNYGLAAAGAAACIVGGAAVGWALDHGLDNKHTSTTPEVVTTAASAAVGAAIPLVGGYLSRHMEGEGAPVGSWFMGALGLGIVTGLIGYCLSGGANTNN